MRVPRVKVFWGLYPLCMKTIEVFQAAMWGVQVAQDPTSVPTSAVEGKSTACVQLFSVMAESASTFSVCAWGIMAFGAILRSLGHYCATLGV